MPLRAALLASALLVSPAALAHHVDPYEVIDRAFKTFMERGDDAGTRAIFSAALRDAPHDGKLDPSFALVFAMYADLVRNNGDPSFALLLTDQGLALALGAAEPDEDAKNALLTSRAYALADLGRYREAVETVAIAALWLGERYGQTAREDLEAEAREWARQDNLGADGELPSALQSALDLLQQAQAAIGEYDTATAIMLTSRAMLPEGAGLDTNAVRTVNAWSRQIAGIAYALEERNREAVAALRDAVDFIAEEPWDGRSRPQIRSGLTGEGGRHLIWNIFIRLAETALDTNDSELAAAALDVAQNYIATPVDRYSLLVQRAALLMRSADLTEVEQAFKASEIDAQAAGDEENAALARFYAAVVKLTRATRSDTARGEGQEMLDAASAAAKAAQANPRQVEYILTTAVWQAAINSVPPETVLPVARQAFAAFRARQREMAGYDSGQEAARRERRRFLESYLDTLYDADG